MRHVAVVALCAAFVAAGIGNEVRAGSVTVDGVSLDDAYAGFRRGEITELEARRRGAGTAVRYAGDEGVGITAYVYTAGQPVIPDGPDSPVVAAEFERVIDEVQGFWRQQTGGATELVGRTIIGTPGRRRAFLCGEFVLHDKTGARRSFLYLTGAANRFVKVRVTLAGNEAKNPLPRRFVDALAKGLWRKSAGGIGAFVERASLDGRTMPH